MKKRHLSRVLSLLLVLAMLAGYMIPVSAAGTQSGLQSLDFELTNDVDLEMLNAVKTDAADEDTAHADSDIVRVSIVMDEAPAMERFGAADVTANTAVASYRNELKAQQNHVAQEIETATGETLDVVWNLTYAANLISANIPYGQIEQIEMIPGVKKVVLETLYLPMVLDQSETADPNMATSPVQIGSSAAWAAGYTGAGSRIAVIDTGIDVDHQSFAEAGYEYSLAQLAEKDGMDAETFKESLNLLDQAKIEDVLDQLNIKDYPSVSAKNLYLSSKIPFAYNYIDLNTIVDHDHDAQGEHGSHVEGISAANAYIQKDDGTFVNALEEVKVQGVAPDAQLLVMKVFGASGGAYDSDYMAAIEDAIVLGCDSINLSLGSAAPGFTRNEEYQDILNSLCESGSVVAIAAGNAGNWAENSTNGGYLYSSDVNFQTAGSPATYTNSLAVASVDNAGYTGTYFTVAGKQVFYSETSFGNRSILTLLGTHDYIFMDNPGDDGDYWNLPEHGEEVEGKIVFVQRGGISFSEKANQGYSYNAAAVIVCNTEDGMINMDLSESFSDIPCISISKADADMIRSASTLHAEVNEYDEEVTYYTGKLTITKDIDAVAYDPAYYTMSSFSSWGVAGSLELKPEITAPGGSIYSVDGSKAGGKSYETMSGTSMATPQISGMAALLGQYIRENKLVESTGKSERQLINSLLMSTATPVINGDNLMPYSVLQQGAGLANVNDAINAKSYLMMDDNLSGTASDGKVKAELGDDPDREGEYSFSFTINNLNGQQQEYTFSTDLFTQAIRTEKGVDYLDTLTTPVAAHVSYVVDGQSFVPTSKIVCDVNGDGVTDEKDAQLVLDSVVGLETLSEAQQIIADVDEDGEITSYDAYLILKGLTIASVDVPLGSQVNVTVNIELTDEAKAELDANYENGAYIEGYVYVDTANTPDGERLPAHSIPVLGFYGNWSDPSMFDHPTMSEKLTGDTRTSYFGTNVSTNYPIIGYPGDSSQYVLQGNPYVSDDPDQLYRLAVNSRASFKRYNVSLIRNAAAGAFFVKDADGNVIYMGSLGTQMEGAYYHVNYASWNNDYFYMLTSWKPSSSGLVENDTFTAGIVMVPEYYEQDGDIDRETLEDLMTSGELGKGAYCTATITIDDTAPELLDVQKDETTGDLIVTAKDNQYIAALAVNKGTGSKRLATVIPEQSAPGQTTTTRISMPEYTSEYVTLVVADYAGNRTSYKVYYNGKIPDSTGKLFAYTRSNMRGQGPRWMEVDPDTLAYRKPGASGFVTYDSMDYQVTAAEYVGGYVFFSTLDAIYAAPQTDLSFVQKVSNLSLGALDYILDMAYNTQNGKLYAIIGTVKDTNNAYGDAQRADTATPLVTIDLVTGELEQVAEISLKNPKYDKVGYKVPSALTIDDDGNFYAVNRATSGTGCYLYTWTLDDITDGKIVNLPPIADSKTGYISNVNAFGPVGMTYDHDKQIIYFAAGTNGRGASSTSNKLMVLDPKTGKGTTPNTAYDGIFYDRVTSIYTVPSKTDTIGKDASVYVIPTESARTILQGASFSVTAEVFPWFVDDKSVTWTTSDDGVAVVTAGRITGVGVGTATITAASNADTAAKAYVTVTVEKLPNIEFSGLVTDASGNSYWADFETDDPEDWSVVSEADSYIAGTLHDDQLILHDGETVYTVDPDSFQTEEIGAIQPELIWSDSAESPRADDGTLGNMVGLCTNGDYLMQLDIENNTAVYRQLTGYYALWGQQMAAIAYIGSGTQRHIYMDSITYEKVDAMLPANFYYVLTETGKLVKVTIVSFDRNTQHYEFISEVGQTDLDLTGVSNVTDGKYASMIFDQETQCLLVSVYTEGNQTELYAIDPNDCLAAYLGTFGEKNYPVVSLYQHKRATDLTLKVKPSSVELYAGDEQKIDAKVVLGDTDALIWSSSDESVAVVDDGVITGVSEGTAVVTATTVAKNQSGESVSADIQVTVKPLTKIDGVVSAQITRDGVTSWVNLDLGKELEVDELAEGKTQLSSGGLHHGSIYGSDLDLNDTGYGNLIRVDAETFEEFAGPRCHVSNAPRDVSTAPTTSFSYTVSGTKLSFAAFDYPVLITNIGATALITDFENGGLASWRTQSALPGLSAITYVGDTTVGEVNASLDGGSLPGADDDTTAHIYYVLSDTGTLYEFIIAPSYNSASASVAYNLLTGTIAELGMKFDRSALSMEFVEVNAESYGLLIADATDCGIYYVDLAKDVPTFGKVGRVDGASNLTALYNATAIGFMSASQAAHSLELMQDVQSLPEADLMDAADEMDAPADAYAFTVIESAVEPQMEENEEIDAFDDTWEETELDELSEGMLYSVAVKSADKPNAAGGTGDADAHVLTVQVTDTEDATNGLYVVNYDPAKVTLTSKSSSAALKSFRVDEAKGEITFAFANASAMTAGTALATLTFSYGDYVNTQITIEAKQRNDASDLDEEPAVISIEDEVGDHNWVETDRLDATCTEDGYVDYKCTKCEATRRDILDALGHDWVETDRKDATCTEDGYIDYACSRCEATRRDILDALGHDWVETGHQDASCEEDGYTDYLCRNGGETRRDVIPAIGHFWVAAGHRDPTCTEDGYDEYYCPNGDETRREIIPAVGHVFRKDEQTGKYFCTICGEEMRNSGAAVSGDETSKPGNGLPFVDVDEKDSYYDAVEYLYRNNIMNGTSATQFSPDAELTRAMVVTILYRVQGQPAVTTSGSFTDVAAGRYYTDAVEWAAANNIVKGFTDGTFKPDEPVTREQLAAFLARVAKFNGIETEAGELLANANVSDWAKQDVAWAVTAGILSTAQAMNAKQTATRAEVAMALYAYLTKAAK